MDRLEYVAQALLIYETLDAEQFIKAFNKELDLTPKQETAATETEEVIEVKESQTEDTIDDNKDNE